MDLSNPVALMSGLVIGGLGAAMFIFGTKQQRLMPVLGGVYWMEKNS